MKLWARQLWTYPALLLTMACAVGFSAAFVALIPRVIDHVSQQDLAEALTDADPAERNIQIERNDRIGPGGSGVPFRYVERTGARLRDEVLPTSVEELVTDEQFVVQSPRFRVSSFPDAVEGPFPTTFRFQQLQGVDDHVEFVAGTEPQRQPPILMFRGRECPDEPLAPADFETQPSVECFVDRIPVFDTAVTAQTAADMSVAVGDMVMLTPQYEDLAWRLVTASGDLRLILRISGIVELSDPDLEYWYADDSLHRPRITENADYRLVDGVGLFGPTLYQELLRATPGVPLEYGWRYRIDSGRVEAEAAEQLASDLSRLAPDDADVRTQLPELLGEFVDQRRLVVTLLWSVVAAMLAVAIGSILVVGLLLAERQRDAAELLVDRGSSRSRQLGYAIITGLVIVAPPTILGWIAARSLLPSKGGQGSWQVAAVFSVVALLTTTVALAPLRPFTRFARSRDSRVERIRRVVVDLVLIGMAVAAVVLVRRRASDEAGEVLERSEALVAIAPILVMVAASLVAVRAFAPVTRLAARAVDRGRTVVPFVALRRAASVTGSGRSPLFVVIMAVAVAVLSATIGGSLADAQSAHALRVVGADIRVDAQNEGVPLPPSLDLRQFEDQAEFASGTILYDRTVIGARGGVKAQIVAIEAGPRADMAGQSAEAAEVLRKLAAGGGASSGADLSAVVSQGWAARLQPEVGDEIELRIGGASIFALVTATVDDIHLAAPNQPAVLVDLDALARFVDDRLVRPRFVYLNGPTQVTDAVGTMADADVVRISLSSRQTVRDQVAGDPFARWTKRLLWGVALSGVAFGLLGVVAGAVMAAAARRRDIVMLRTLGLTAKQAARMALIEQLPSLAAAVVVGAGTGAILSVLLEPALSLSAFAGGGDSGIDIEGAPIVGVALAVGLLMTVAIAAAELRQRARIDATLLRVGDE